MMKLEEDYQETKGCVQNNHPKENLNLKRTFHGNAYSKSSTPKSSKVVNKTGTVSIFIRSGSKIHNILPKEPERT